MSKYSILAYFSQSAGTLPTGNVAEQKMYLGYLNSERKKMKENCERGGFTFLTRESDEVTIEKINTDLKVEKENVVIFHYSGHADRDRLFFQDEEDVRAEGLANLLGQCPNLRIVFLNGCCTKSHVYHLFKNKVKFVIATNYAVKDIEAFHFAALFYQSLIKERKSIQQSFRDSAGGSALRGRLSSVIPPELRVQPTTLIPNHEISNLSRGGINVKKPTGPVWGFHSYDAGDPMTDGLWIPEVRQKNDLSRAFTCGRFAMSDLFANHWRMNFKEKRVLHYFMMDEARKSLEGVSIKSLFENIISSYDKNAIPFHHYPCDPNQPSFRENMVKLLAANKDKGEVIDMVCTKIVGSDFLSNNSGIRTFSDLYLLPPVKNNQHVFIFITVEKNVFTTIKTAITDFIEESIRPDISQGKSVPLLIFFWHVVTKRGITETLGLPNSFRDQISKEFLEKFSDHVAFLHESGMKPIPMPESEDLLDWVGEHGYDEENYKHLKGVLDEFQNVPLLENKLSELIQKK